MIPKADGYLTTRGELNLPRISKIFEILGLVEEVFFNTGDNRNRRENNDGYSNQAVNIVSEFQNLKPPEAVGKEANNEEMDIFSSIADILNKHESSKVMSKEEVEACLLLI
jgi:5'-3' exonuclease